MKKWKKLCALATVLTLVVTMFSGTVIAQDTKEHAFDSANGRIDVDYAGFLSKHNLVYNAPIKDPAEGMPVGSGRVGAMVWNENGPKMELANVDASPQTAMSEAQVSLQTIPAVSTDKFQQTLNIYNGNMDINYNDEQMIKVFGVPGTEGFGIHVKDTRENIKMISFDINVWQREQEGITRDLAAWRTCTPFVDGDMAGISRGISKTEPYGYTFAAQADEALVEIEQVSDELIRFYLTPQSDEYTIWMSTATVLNAQNGDSVTAAKQELANLKAKGYDAVLQESQSFWNDYWEKSFISYENGTSEGDYIENNYYLSQYLIAAGSLGTKPFHFIDGVWKYAKDTEGRWNNYYWHFNERDVYNWMPASNHPDMMDSYINFYLGLADTMKANTNKVYGIEDAIKVSETIDWMGVGEDNEFTGPIMSTGSEIAINMFNQYEYTGDKAFLEKCYPFMKDVADFYVGYLVEEDNQYKIKNTNCKENWWNVDNAISDQAAIRCSFPNLIKTMEILGKDTPEDLQYIEKLKDILNRLEPIETDGTKYLPYKYPEVKNNNMECPELEMIWPMTITGLGYDDYDLAKNTFDNRTHKGLNIWTVTAIQAARLGLGDEATDIMKGMIQAKQNHINGICDDTNGKFEANGIHVGTINEMYLQSYNNQIRVFAGVPSDSNFKGKFTLLAKGGHLVTSEYENGSVKYIGIKSQLGGDAVVISPWADESVKVNGEPAAVVDGKITIPTQAGEVYTIERDSDPLSAYTKIQLTGTANMNEKIYNTVSLGKKTNIDLTKIGYQYDFETITGTTVPDISGRGNDAVIVGAVNQVDGKNGKGIEFSNSMIKVPSNDTTQLIDEFELSFWMNLKSVTDSTIFDKYGSNGKGLYFDMYNGTYRVFANGDPAISISATPKANEWIFVKFVYSTKDGYCKVYFNEEEVGSKAVDSAMPINTQDMYIGMSRMGSQPIFGIIDDFTVKPILSDDEVEVPQANNQSYDLTKNQVLKITNNSYQPDTGVYYELTDGPSNGTLTYRANGSFSYTPNTDFVGIDTFTYALVNGSETEQATVTIWVKEEKIKHIIKAKEDYTGKTGEVTTENSGGFESWTPGALTFDDGALKLSVAGNHTGGSVYMVNQNLPEVGSGKVYIDFQFKMDNYDNAQTPRLFALGMGCASPPPHVFQVFDCLSFDGASALYAEGYNSTMETNNMIMSAADWKAIRNSNTFHTWQYIVDFDNNTISVNIDGNPTRVQNTTIPENLRSNIKVFSNEFVPKNNGSSETSSLWIKDFEMYTLEEPKNLAVVQTDAGIKAAADFVNEGESTNASVILVAYQNGKLVDSVSTAPETVAKGAQFRKQTDPLALPAGTYQLKAFLWNSLEDMVPLKDTAVDQTVTVS